MLQAAQHIFQIMAAHFDDHQPPHTVHHRKVVAGVAGPGKFIFKFTDGFVVIGEACIGREYTAAGISCIVSANIHRLQLSFAVAEHGFKGKALVLLPGNIPSFHTADFFTLRIEFGDFHHHIPVAAVTGKARLAFVGNSLLAALQGHIA